MISYECRVGRLIEIRIGSPFDLLQAASLGASAAALFAQRTERFVSVVDMRRLAVLSPEVAEDMITNLKRANKRIERTGVLLPTSPTLALQVERMHREAGNPERRTFRDAAALRAFVAPLLTDEESARVAELLSA